MLGVHEFADYIVVALVTMFLLLIPVTPMVFWVLYDSPPPSAIGFSGEGFHLWYDSPYDWQLNDDLIPWAEIKVIERRRAGKSSYWALERTTGEVDDLAFLTEVNRKALIQEFKGRGLAQPTQMGTERPSPG